MRRRYFWGVVFCVSAMAFAFGLHTGTYRTDLFDFILKMKHTLMPADLSTRSWYTEAAPPMRKMLASLFDRPLPPVERFVTAPVRNMEDLAARIDGMRVLAAQDFFLSPRIVPGDPLFLDRELVSLPVQCNDQAHTAYAYRLACFSDTAKGGVLVIPGSGDNQAFEIKNGLGYHGNVASFLRQWFDVFVLIKPNHGVRVIHDGEKAYSRYNFVPGLLNEGFSYSATYLAEGLALLAYLRKAYPLNGVVGLSQGGKASLIVSLLSSPDFSVVASGYSVALHNAPMDNVGQIIIPGLESRLLAPNRLKALLAASSTDFLFSWGKEEGGVYGREAETMETCTFFHLDNLCANVSCVYHCGGHEFPFQELETWLGGLTLTTDKQHQVTE